MRLPFIVVSLILMGCSQEKKSDFKVYLDLKDKAIKSNVSDDTTFLKFAFGMTKDSVLKKIKQLESDSLLIYDYEERNYIYHFNTDKLPYPIKCAFNPQFFNDSLYRISLVTQSETRTDASLFYVVLESALGKKYGHSPVRYNLVGSGEGVTAWFSNNVEIKLKDQAANAAISFTDLHRETRKDLLEKQQQQVNSDKTIKDL